MKRLKSAAEFEIDLELPQECWDLEDLDDELAGLLRMTFMAGYIKATKDAKSGKIGSLITRVGRIQSAKPKRRVEYDGPS